jgi:hypothetical protein
MERGSGRQARGQDMTCKKQLRIEGTERIERY